MGGEWGLGVACGLGVVCRLGVGCRLGLRCVPWLAACSLGLTWVAWDRIPTPHRCPLDRASTPERRESDWGPEARGSKEELAVHLELV